MLYLHPPSKFKIYNMTNDNNRGRISRIHFQYKEKVTIFFLYYLDYIFNNMSSSLDIYSNEII